ncbi:MAG TPA: FMN-binding negative transcriptional regulator [Rhodoblastus sp.]|nr:FMN-binding negative transcriptional regulator [Rhodoblastus sp.]
MYLPPHFRTEDRAEQFALIRARPFGLLVTNGPSGLMANPAPFLLDEDAGVLRAHLARPNPQWREADGSREALVVFQDVDAYVTPGWYATKRETGRVVPTWNYSAVHVYGALRAIDDRAWLRKLVGDLTDAHEASLRAPWKVEDAPSDYIDVMLRGIVGIEVQIARIEGKAKLSQNRSAADRAGVVDGLRATGGEAALRMAAQVEGATKS